MKNLISVLAIALGLLAAPSSAETVIKLGTFAPSGSRYHDILLDLQHEWAAISGGAVVLRIYPGGVTGDESDMVRKMRVGQLQAATLTSGGLPDIDPDFRAFQIPMMFETLDEFDHVLTTHRASLDAMLRARGFRALGWVDAGWLYFFSRRPVSVPDDLRPQPIFVWNGADRFVEAWRAGGFRPRQLAATDIHTALQSGLLEAVSAPPLMALSNQWFAQVPHMSDLKFVPMMACLVVSDRAWRKISRRLRAPLAAAAARAVLRMRREVHDDSTKAIDVMRDHGLTVRRVKPGDIALWRDAVNGSFGPMIGPYIDAALVRKIEATLHAYRAAN